MDGVIRVGQVVQKWGNDLAVRIAPSVAKAAKVTRGQLVTIEVSGQGVLIRKAGRPRLTLAMKLKAVDPKIHGGEAMASGCVGIEVF